MYNTSFLTSPDAVEEEEVPLCEVDGSGPTAPGGSDTSALSSIPTETWKSNHKKCQEKDMLREQ